MNSPQDITMAHPAPFTLLEPGTLRDQRLRALYQEVILVCLHHRIERWWDCLGEFAFCGFDSFAVLRRLLRDLLLHRAGDVPGFLRLTRTLDSIGGKPSSKDLYLETLAQTYSGALQAIRTSVAPGETGRRPFLLACPVWGEHYLEVLQTCCLPSLLAPGNLPALCGERDPVLLIHTDAQGRATLSSSPVMAQVAALGVEIRYLMLDAALIAGMHQDPNFKYWHLGMIQSLELFYAKALRADYHILLPDVIYAGSFFASLLGIVARGNPMVLQMCFRTEAARVLKAVAEFRKDGALSLAAEDLMAFALNCLHPTFEAPFMNFRPSGEVWPTFHALLWEGPETLHVASPHHTLGYVDRSILENLPERYFFTLDSEVDKLVPRDCNPYFPKRADGLVIIELSPANLAAEPSRYISREVYAALFWERVESMRHLDFFQETVEYPISQSRRDASKSLPEAQILAEMAEARYLVGAGRGPSSLLGMMNGLLSLHGAETHPQARDLVPRLREEAHAIWRQGASSVEPSADDEMMHQILRMLGHFDLLDDAREALDACASAGTLALALNDFLQQRDRNAVHAGTLVQIWHGTVEPTVVGMTVWGADYLAFFLDYHLPSLLAAGNLPALAKRGRILYSIVTDAAGRELIQRSPAFAALGNHAECHFTVIGPVPSRATAEGRHSFYQRVGLLDHLHVHLSRTLTANLILLPPDTILSRMGFHTLVSKLDEGFDACTIAGIEGGFEAVKPDLDGHKAGGVLDIDARDLCALAVRHMTPYFRSLIVDPGILLNAYPREFFWRVPAGFICHSIFMHPLILSARVLARPFHPNHENVDWALLPRVLWGDARLAILDGTSELFVMHCSDGRVKPDEFSAFRGRIDPKLGHYLLKTHQHDFPIHRSLFKRPQFFPVAEVTVATNPNYLEESSTLLAMFDSVTPPADPH